MGLIVSHHVSKMLDTKLKEIVFALLDPNLACTIFWGVILSPIPYKIEISILWQAYNYIFIFIGIYNWKFSSSITEDVGLCLKLELLFHVIKRHDPKRVGEEWICFAYSYTP